MAEEEFEIDVYGDAGNDNGVGEHDNADGATYDGDDSHDANGHNHHEYDDQREEKMEDNADQQQSPSSAPQQLRPQQGVKRKEGSDERPVDPGATTAILVSELNWWNTDDDIRGWVAQANCEAELRDITFSEHKVNGKSKGQAYIEFTSQQAATATKHYLDGLQTKNTQPPGQKLPTVIYSSPTNNPFRTLPKDAPNRGGAKDTQNRTPSGPGYNDRGSNFAGNQNNNNYNSGGFRGGRGGFTPRGGGMNSGGFQRNNFQGSNMNAFNNNMGGFNNPMAGGGFGGGGFNRGGMMGGGMRGGGMRGGRGGGMNPMMGGMAMGGMGPMGGMPGAMAGMGMMGAGMPGFQGMPTGFNPAFFQAQAANPANEWQNPHGAKRARGE
ncbi:hypothetical protein B0H63DRAFT_35460 [Podospora didyma]|uniref:RRM domain-containing protein n=1 Tax=Podospora didyma TaxID=330526 RepID=A0AAE0P643_9PEZI|nr:hypothetical protein B0H63DRAFT_35460 [Podospora didyma]